MFFLYTFDYDSGDLCREALLSYLTSGDDVLVLGSLGVLATLLQTKGEFYYNSAYFTTASFSLYLLTISFCRTG
jgi:hypothetical protein